MRYAQFPPPTGPDTRQEGLAVASKPHANSPGVATVLSHAACASMPTTPTTTTTTRDRRDRYGPMEWAQKKYSYIAHRSQLTSNVLSPHFSGCPVVSRTKSSRLRCGAACTDRSHVRHTNIRQVVRTTSPAVRLSPQAPARHAIHASLTVAQHTLLRRPAVSRI